MAFIIPESAGRISEFCMHFACDFTGGTAPTQSQLMIVDFQHDCPLHNSPFNLWTQGSYKPRPSQHTARSGNELVPLFCKSSTLMVATASSFLLRLSTCDSSLLQEPVSCSKTNLSSVVPDAATTLLRLQSSDCRTLWATLERIRSMHTQPAGFLTKQATRSGIHSSQASKDARSQRTANTRTLPISRFPNGECSLQNSQVVQ